MNSAFIIFTSLFCESLDLDWGRCRPCACTLSLAANGKLQVELGSSYGNTTLAYKCGYKWKAACDAWLDVSKVWLWNWEKGRSRRPGSCSHSVATVATVMPRSSVSGNVFEEGARTTPKRALKQCGDVCLARPAAARHLRRRARQRHRSFQRRSAHPRASALEPKWAGQSGGWRPLAPRS